MTIDTLKNELEDFAKDTRLNLGSVLSEEGAPGLSENQIWGTALACAYHTKDRRIVDAVLESASLSDEYVTAAKSAASIMAMNATYYRFLHLSEDEEMGKLPARLRMNVIGRPGIEKVDFEAFSLGIAVLEGCAMCINAHAAVLTKADVSRQGVQSVARIAAVINAAAQSLSIQDLSA